MSKRIERILIIFLLVVFLTGCSYRELDDKIQSAIRNTELNGADGFTSDGRAYYETDPITEDNIEYKGIHESFPGYVEFADSEGNSCINGTRSIVYTLNSVKVFDSIYDADIDLYGCTMTNEEMLKSNAFILVDITTNYTAPADGEDEMIASATIFNGAYLEGCGNDDFGDRADGKHLEPNVIYFSERPKEDDERLNYQHDAFSYIIKDGESFTFQLGILAAKEFIDTENVFLSVNAVMQGVIKDYPYKYFVLFPKSEG